MIKVTTSNSQEVKAAIQKELKKFTKSGFVTVGIHEDAGNHPDSKDTNASIGAKNHYGVGVPARPFLDVGVDSGVREYLQIIKQSISDGDTLEKALEKIGVVAAAKVQQYMTELKTPPNSPYTIAKKGSSNPLIDTGALKQSVTYKLTLKKPSEGLS